MCPRKISSGCIDDLYCRIERLRSANLRFLNVSSGSLTTPLDQTVGTLRAKYAKTFYKNTTRNICHGSTFHSFAARDATLSFSLFSLFLFFSSATI